MSHIRVTRSFGSGGCRTWPVVVVPLTHLWSVLSFLGQMMGDQLTFRPCLIICFHYLYLLHHSDNTQSVKFWFEHLLVSTMYVVLFQKYV